MYNLSDLLDAGLFWQLAVVQDISPFFLTRIMRRKFLAENEGVTET
jgi:hypothetical protein